MKPCRRTLLTAALWSGALMAVAAEPPLRVCLNDVPHPPWRMSDSEGRSLAQGLDFLFLDLLAQRSNLEVKVSLVPWKRCLADLQNGEFDASLTTSYLPERQAVGVYPFLNGKLDESLKQRTIQYSWYVRRDSPAKWDGRRLTGLAPGARVGAPSGFSVGQVAKTYGLTLDDSQRTVLSHLERLQKRQVEVVALDTHGGDQALRERPDLAQIIHRLDPLLQERDYYMVFSHAYWKAHPQRVQALWRHLQAIRNSEAYQQAVNEQLAPARERR